jgi:hypothetical protein
VLCTCAWRSCQQQRSARHLLALDELNDDACCFSGLLLPYKACSYRQCNARIVQAKAFDMGVHSNSLRLGGGLHLLDLLQQ